MFFSTRQPKRQTPQRHNCCPNSSKVSSSGRLLREGRTAHSDGEEWIRPFANVIVTTPELRPPKPRLPIPSRYLFILSTRGIEWVRSTTNTPFHDRPIQLLFFPCRYAKGGFANLTGLGERHHGGEDQQRSLSPCHISRTVPLKAVLLRVRAIAAASSMYPYTYTYIKL